MASAGEGAQRKADAAALKVKDAQGRLEAAQREQHRWSRGAEGERRTAEALALLTGEGWLVLHDVHWPGRPFANIDHIAIGPGGVIVIDTKNWAGRVDVANGVLRQNGYSRAKECADAGAEAAAVAAWLEPRHRALVGSLICLVDQPTPSQQPAQVRAVGLTDLPDALRDLPVRLSPTDVSTIAGHLALLLDGSASPQQLSTKALPATGPAAREDSHRVLQAKARARPSSTVPAPRRRTRHPRAATARSTVTTELLKGAAVILLLIFCLVWVKSLNQHLALEGPTPKSSSSPTATAGADQP